MPFPQAPQIERIGSCIVRTGFRQIPHRGAGLSKLHRRLADGPCCDRRPWPLLALRPWDADTDTDAELVRDAAAGRHVEIDYSYGAGHGLVKFSASLKKLCPNKPIDLAILVDPVTRYRWTKWRSLRHGGAYLVPANVSRVAVFRTVNQPTWKYPVGHDLVLENPRTKVVANVVYGSAKALREWEPREIRDTVGGGTLSYQPETQIEPDIDHLNIDEFEPVHDRAVSLIEQLIAGDL